MKLEKCELKLNEYVLTDDITLEVGNSECVGLIASSGFGKTSLFRAMLGVKGYELNGFKKLREVSYIPQSDGLVSWLSLNQHQRLYDIELEQEWINVLGLEELMDRKVYELSGGQYHRGLILLAMTKAKENVLLDEPFVSLDILSKERAIKWMKRIVLKKKLKLLVASHDIDFLFSFCDKVFILTKDLTKALQVADFETEEEFKKEVLDTFIGY